MADVNSNPRNPVIGMRSFGADPARVAAHVAAFVEGQQAAGVAACAKHFPGHGDTSLDSHLALPTTAVSEAELEAGPLVPFRAAIAAGVRSIMTAHIVVPRWTSAGDAEPDDPHRPAARAARLRGMVITDALDMGAISRGAGVEQGAVRSLAAGADALCLGPQVDEAGVAAVHRAIVAAVQDGQLAEERLREAAARVRATARSLGAAGAPDRELGRSAAARGRDRGWPIGRRWPARWTSCCSSPTRTSRPGRAPSRSATPWSRCGPACACTASARGRASRSAAVRWCWCCATRSVTPGSRGPPASLRPDVVVEVGLPGWRPDSPAPYVVTHGAGRASLEAAASLLARPPA